LTIRRTNVPDIAMCFSDSRFPYGPFPPHWVPRHYLENYFSLHRADKLLVLNTTVEDVSRISGTRRWMLTLRRRDSVRHVDEWWKEEFDAVILANGHYSVPYVGSSSAFLSSTRLYLEVVFLTVI
jgi:cation diffusion facilitator CzcD-associated flavoprotein CzcO